MSLLSCLSISIGLSRHNMMWPQDRTDLAHVAEVAISCKSRQADVGDFGVQHVRIQLLSREQHVGGLEILKSRACVIAIVTLLMPQWAIDLSAAYSLYPSAASFGLPQDDAHG